MMKAEGGAWLWHHFMKSLSLILNFAPFFSQHKPYVTFPNDLVTSSTFDFARCPVCGWPTRAYVDKYPAGNFVVVRAGNCKS
jgi:hypothetical protein